MGGKWLHGVGKQRKKPAATGWLGR
jgi:hypothetical protein